MTGAVGLNVEAIVSAWRRGQDRNQWLSVTGIPSLRGFVDAAAGSANPDDLDDDGARAMFIGTGHRHDVVIRLGEIDSEAHLVHWLERFAAHLTGALGITAPRVKIATGRVSSVPTPMRYGSAGLVSTAFMTLRRKVPALRLRTAPRAWNADPGTTAMLARFTQDWLAARGAAHLELSRGQFRWRGDVSDVAALVSTSLGENERCRAAFTTDDALTIWCCSFNAHGRVLFQGRSATQSLDTTRAQLIEVIRTLAPVLELGFVRPAAAWSRSWSDLEPGNYKLPDATAGAVREAPQLVVDAVPDASAAQVIPRSVAARIAGGDRWTIEDIEGGMSYVEARDLTIWPVESPPDPQVLATARADFASIILRDTAVRQFLRDG